MDNNTMNRNDSIKGRISEKSLSIVTVIQSLMLSAYGVCALLLHHQMQSYELGSVGSAGGPVHIFYLATMLIGAFLIIYRVIKDRKTPGFIKSAGFLTPVIVTVAAMIFSQANTVYTSTNGGSVLGFVGYFFRALASGNDPIDAFFYGTLTVPKYIFVILLGAAAAAYTAFGKDGLSSIGINRLHMMVPAKVGSAKIKTVAVEKLKDPVTGAEVIEDETIDNTVIEDEINEGETSDTESGDCESSSVMLPVKKESEAKNKTKTNIRKIAAALVLITILAAGTVAYAEIFSLTKYDINDVTTGVVFAGYDGEGIASEPCADYDKLDTLGFENAYNLSDVLDTVEYKITPNEGLSNGDVVTLEAVYDEDMARARRIKLTGLKKEIKVEGLAVRPKAEEITKNALKEAQDAGKETLAESYESYSTEFISAEPVVSYFIAPEATDWAGTYNDRVVMVYKVRYSEKDFWNDTTEEYTEYAAVSSTDLSDIEYAETWGLANYGSYYDNLQDMVDSIESLTDEGDKVVRLK